MANVPSLSEAHQESDANSDAEEPEEQDSPHVQGFTGPFVTGEPALGRMGADR